MEKGINKCEVLDRIKSFYSLKGNTELARFLGVAPNIVTNWYRRNTLNLDVILDKCTTVNLNWLLTGAVVGDSQNESEANKMNAAGEDANTQSNIIERNRDFLDRFRLGWFKGLKPTNITYMQIAYYDQMTNLDIQRQIDVYRSDLQQVYNNYSALHRVLYSLNPPGFMKDKFTPNPPFDEYYDGVLSEFDEDMSAAGELNDDKLKNILFILHLKDSIGINHGLTATLIHYMDHYRDMLTIPAPGND